MKDKYLITLGVGIIVFLGLFYLVFYAREIMRTGFEEPPVVKESEAKLHDPEKWVEYRSGLTHFRAYFPNQPKTDAQAVSIAGEDTLKAGLNVFVAEMPDQSTLMVKVLRFPDDYTIKDVGFQLNETMNTILNAARDNTLRDIKNTDWQGHQALNFAIQNQQIRIQAKSIYANRSIYTVIYAARIDNFDSRVFQDFLERFVITTDFKSKPDDAI